MQGAFTFTDSRGRLWYLHTKEVTLRNGHVQQIYYFKQEEDFDYSCAMPEGYEVMETARTGMPVLRKTR